jgi:hypothetical protein
MAKRDSGGKRTNTAAAPTASGAAMTPDAMEQRVVAFAEQLGRMVGTVQAKAEGWMDRDALNKQIASVRDSAADLLDQLSDGVTTLTGTAKKAAMAATTGAAKTSKGRSGGAVDAPGKKHRKPAPRDSRAIAADAKAKNMRAAAPSMKTNKTRGRG